ncbi:hypothetical protein LSH36_667g01068 [Paralvinella palmiformis]|uniref:Uncharacterized protein n=1 Tax=Paralvinella palmiformis TaxID=53620 RepID=A0AAD9J3X6_9ANNE|nr:hypothetical protein LSH36_667g01068 [Paralvinella palmiformis]
MSKHSKPGARIKQGLSEMRAVFESPAIKLSKSSGSKQPPPVPQEGPPTGSPRYSGSPQSMRYHDEQADEAHCLSDSPRLARYPDGTTIAQYQNWDEQVPGRELGAQGMTIQNRSRQQSAD